MSLPLPAPLLREGREVLAITLGTRRKEHALRMFPALNSEPGYRVHGERIEEWRLEGFFTADDTLYLYGPAESGRLLETVAAAAPLREGDKPGALPYLMRLAAALARLEAGGIQLEHLQTDSVLFLDDGGVLFLPPGLMKKASELRPGTYKLQVFELVNHPDWLPARKGVSAASRRGGAAHLSFALGTLAYRAILGEYPFQADSEEEIHNKIRHLRLTPLSARLPGLRSEASRFVLRALGREDEPAPNMEDWVQELARWSREGLFRPLDPQERRELAERARVRGEQAARAYRRRVFWQRKGLTVGIAAAVVVVVGVLAGTYLRTLLAPRATLGFTPRQVVEAYLQGINSLDHALMEDCTVDRAGRQTIREVMNIYVMSRVTLGYEGRSNVLRADEWDRMGRPQLVPPETVFGITDLEVRSIRGEPEPVFEASYRWWVPVPPQEPGGGGQGGSGDGGQASQGGSGDGGLAGRGSAAAGEPGEPGTPHGPTVSSREVTERFFLRSQRGYWVIYRIEPG